jgi:hypothetical protein
MAMTPDMTQPCPANCAEAISYGGQPCCGGPCGPNAMASTAYMALDHCVSQTCMSYCPGGLNGYPVSIVLGSVCLSCIQQFCGGEINDCQNN